MNDKEIDLVEYNYVLMDLLNGIEYSHDYSKIPEKNGYVLNDIGTAGHSGIEGNPADTIRARMYNNLTFNGFVAATAGQAAQGNNPGVAPTPGTPGTVVVNIKVPFTDLSKFLSAVDFPIIGNSIKFEIILRPKHILYVLEAAHPGNFAVAITSVVAYVLQVMLPTEYYEKTISGFLKKTVKWEKVQSIHDITGIANNVLYSKMINPNVVNTKKLIVLYSTEANNVWGTHLSRNTTSTTDLSICNIEVNSKKMYSDGLRAPHEFYEAVCNLFNYGGTNKSTGALLSYTNFLKANIWYCFDLKKQEIFETGSRVNQQIKMDVIVNVPAGGNNPTRALNFLFVDQETEINMIDSTQTVLA